jgi:hypothetical protein
VGGSQSMVPWLTPINLALLEFIRVIREIRSHALRLLSAPADSTIQPGNVFSFDFDGQLGNGSG